ncbi:MAG: TIGR04086 family membrane protein [Eubacteriales bacterium]
MNKKNLGGTRNNSKGASVQGAKEEFSLKDSAVSVLLGVGIMCIAALLMLLVGSIISYTSADPSATEKYISLAALYLSIFAGGFATVKFYRSYPLVNGIFFAAAALLVVFLMKLILTGGKGENIEASSILSACIIPDALAAALLGSRRSHKIRSRKAPNFRKKH